MKTKKVLCPKCGGNNVILKGKEETKFGFVQLFYCKDCKRKFAERGMNNKTYLPGVILNSINYYNLGNTLKDSSKLVNKKFNVKVSKSSIHLWLNEFKYFRIAI